MRLPVKVIEKSIIDTLHSLSRDHFYESRITPPQQTSRVATDAAAPILPSHAGASNQASVSSVH
jgi:hypothetical protein